MARERVTGTRRLNPFRNSTIPTPSPASTYFPRFFACFSGRQAARPLRHDHFPYFRKTAASCRNDRRKHVLSQSLGDRVTDSLACASGLHGMAGWGSSKPAAQAREPIRRVRTSRRSCRRRRIPGLRSWRPAGRGGPPRTAFPARCGSACPAPRARSSRPTGRAR